MCHDSANTFPLICRVRQQRDIARALDGFGKHALTYGAVAGDASRENLASLGSVVLQQPQVFKVDLINFLDAEAADSPPVHAATAALHAASPSILIIVAVITASTIFAVAASTIFVTAASTIFVIA